MIHWFRHRQPDAPAPVPEAARPARANWRAVEVKKNAAPTDLFQPHRAPPGVRGDNSALAMDNALLGYMGANYGITSDYIQDGLNFKGYADLSAMMLRAEFRKPVETIAKEATREWIKIRSTHTGDDDGEEVTDRIRQIEEEFARLRVRDVVRRQITHGLGYGLGHIWIGVKGVPLTTEGQNVPLRINANGIGQGQLDRLINVDPIWTNPNAYNADNPLRPDYYRPQNWWVQGVLVDSSRLLTVVPFEVPDILKPAFNFGGLALPQMLQAYVHNFLRTRQSVSDLVSNFATKVLKTDMTGNMQVGQTAMNFGDIDSESVTGRVLSMNAWQSNNGTFVLDKESEDFDIKAVPLSGIDQLQAQSLEFMAGIPGIPLVKLFGIQPTGLNASSDGEIRVFYDEISAFQEAHVSPSLRAIFHLVQLHLWGEIDPNLDFEFVALWQLSEKDAAEVEKIKSDIDAVNIAAGKVSPEEARDREASDAHSIYQGVDLSGPPPEPPEQEDGTLQSLMEHGEKEDI